MNELKYLYFLAGLDGLGSVRIKRLIEKFGTAEKVFSASAKEIAEIENISDKSAYSIVSSFGGIRKFNGTFDSVLSKAEELGVKIIPITSEEYPELLKRIYDPPVMLYTRGNYDKEKLVNCIGIVGTRKPTDYGKRMSEMFAEELSSIGISVISGFARGIDTAAHKAVLRNKNSEAITAAVFGCGVDMIYPPENKKLYEEMIEKGLLISEYELSAFPDSVNFPKRNRIISGLSYGTIVIESDVDGGALITARTALDQSREVFAVPGYVTSKLSKGTNSLIKNGHAKLVENLDDVLVEISAKLQNVNVELNIISSQQMELEIELQGNEKLVYETFLKQSEPIHIDLISELSGLNISDSLVTLLNLEFKGCIEQLPGKRFKAKQFVKVS